MTCRNCESNMVVGFDDWHKCLICNCAWSDGDESVHKVPRMFQIWPDAEEELQAAAEEVGLGSSPVTPEKIVEIVKRKIEDIDA